MRTLAAVVLLSGCGRIGFEDLAAKTGDASTDGIDGPTGSLAIDPCGSPTTAPSFVTFSGTTVRATQFGAVLIPEPNIMLTVRSGFNGPLIGAGTSDGDGLFALAVATTGTPRAFSIVAERSGLVTTVMLPGYLVDRDLTGFVVPLTDTGGIDSIYSAGGVARNAGRGTFGIEVHDCTHAFVAGAQVDGQPIPERLVYTDAQGIPSPPRTSTTTAGGAFLLNAPLGPVAFDVTAAGAVYASRVSPSVTGLTLVILQFYPAP